MNSLLITNARVIDPASNTDLAGDIAIKDARIAAIGPGLSASDADRVIDAQGRIVCPGLIDPHVHLRDPGQTHKEDIATGTSAAVAGGFTTVCCMPNTNPTLDSPEMLDALAMRVQRHARCRVFPVAAGTLGRKGETIAEINLLAEAGAVAFSDDGDAIASAGMMARVLQAVAPTGRVFMQHAQDPTMTTGSVMHAGEVSARLGLTGWPREAEEIIVDRDVRLARSANCRYHVQHISSGNTVEILRRAQAEGTRATGEASPHHLILTHDACAGDGDDNGGNSYNTLAKMNPPLREAADVQALREGVAEGVITVLATDHAPHTADEKNVPFEDAPFGIIGLETALPLYAEALVTTGMIDWPRLIALMTIEPARLCNLDAQGLGSLTVGGPADLTMIDPDLAWTFTETEVAGKSANSPFLRRELRGRAMMTIVAGEVRHETM